MKGFKHGGSGVKKEVINSLNFNVVVYPSEIELNTVTGDANTIGVVTTNPMTGWHFSWTQPENMAEGEIWFNVSTSSLGAFNALKENTLMVYPVSAKQMVSGALVDVKAKSWIDDKWVEWWDNQLYENGNEFESVTGGWISEAINHPSGGGPHEVTITRNSDSMTIKQESTGGGGIVRTKNKIDLSNISSLVFTGDILGTINNGYVYIYIWSAIGNNFGQNVVASSAINAINKSDTTITIPVAGLNESYYIGFALYSVGITVNMKSFVMEE